MTTDPRAIIDREPMSGFQWGVVAIMVGLNALDGFDVLSISYASPGIAADWGVNRAALGVVLSMELVGMAVGSLVLGGVADALGRRRTILGCLVIMAAGMFAASTAHDVPTLSIYRVITGLGIGGMLAAINAAVAEAANARRRALCVVIMAAGYPIGSVIGGTISGELLQYYDWRAVFVFGGLATLAFIPLVLWRAPESIAFEMQRGGPGALERINRVLKRMRHPTVDALPTEAPGPKPRVGVAKLFAPQFAALTMLLTLAYFSHILTFYFFIKWIPKIVVDLGFAPSAAAQVLVLASLGGASGALVLGLLTLRFSVVRLTIAATVLSSLFVVVFGFGWDEMTQLSLAAFAAGCATNAPIVGLYALVAHVFPTEMRAGATGFVIGVGRGGSALAPAVAGLLFAAGYSLLQVSMLLGLGSLVAAGALLVAQRRIG